MLNSWFVVLSLWVSINNKSKFKSTSKANLSIFVVTLRPFNNLIECFDFLSTLNEVCYSGCSEREQRTARKKKWTTRTERSRSHYFNSIQKVHLNIYIHYVYITVYVECALKSTTRKEYEDIEYSMKITRNYGRSFSIYISAPTRISSRKIRTPEFWHLFTVIKVKM